jgi:hypothetical protein
MPARKALSVHRVHRDFNDVVKLVGFGGHKTGKKADLIRRKKICIVRAREESTNSKTEDPDSHKGHTLRARMLRQLRGGMNYHRAQGKLAMVQLPNGARVRRYLNEYHLERMASEQTIDG